MKKVLALLWALTGPAYAADSWHIGTNNLFIEGYMANQGVTCATGLQCPSNTGNISLSRIDTLLNDWRGSTTGHIGMYREIVTVAHLAPTSVTDSTNWSYIDAVLDKYEGGNLYLIFTPGNPLPSAADPYASNKNGQCWVSSNSTNETTAKNYIAWSVGNYLAHYAGRGAAYATWMQDRLITEGFNEFDAIGNDVTNCVVGAANSPANNADITNGIAYVLNVNSVTVLKQSMASIVLGNYTGPMSGCTMPNCTVNEYFQYYVKDYYTNFGGGAPNIHGYAFGTEADIKSKVEGIASAACTGAGTTHCASMIYGEMGWNLNVPAQTCSGTPLLPSDTIYEDIAADTTLQGNLWAQLFWIGSQVNGAGTGDDTHCSWGFITDSSDNKLTPGNNLRTWLETH
ncbi:MAG: hypothetical protein HRJ53_28125 [Acidobacteria bacterium Pan2503]|uniref:Uncharacterized protein n=1 Tax=Candidatus Acidiferrum panamense TaxID=2741543 RepID=A0A7V8T077_9BACT|nr:hypothetical protein [Candidatus Acidoferrum panamensis]